MEVVSRVLGTTKSNRPESYGGGTDATTAQGLDDDGPTTTSARREGEDGEEGRSGRRGGTRAERTGWLRR